MFEAITVGLLKRPAYQTQNWQTKTWVKARLNARYIKLAHALECGGGVSVTPLPAMLTIFISLCAKAPTVYQTKISYIIVIPNQVNKKPHRGNNLEFRFIRMSCSEGWRIYAWDRFMKSSRHEPHYFVKTFQDGK